jgi:hypothetical protein
MLRNAGPSALAASARHDSFSDQFLRLQVHFPPVAGAELAALVVHEHGLALGGHFHPALVVVAAQVGELRRGFHRVLARAAHLEALHVAVALHVVDFAVLFGLDGRGVIAGLLADFR